MALLVILTCCDPMFLVETGGSDKETSAEQDESGKESSAVTSIGSNTVGSDDSALSAEDKNANSMVASNEASSPDDDSPSVNPSNLLPSEEDPSEGPSDPSPSQEPEPEPTPTPEPTPSETLPSEEDPSEDEQNVTLIFDSIEQMQQAVSSDPMLYNKFESFFTTYVPTEPELQFEGYEIRRIELTYAGTEWFDYQRIDVYWYAMDSEDSEYAFKLTNELFWKMKFPPAREQEKQLIENGYVHMNGTCVYAKDLGEYTHYVCVIGYQRASAAYEIRTDLADKQVVFDSIYKYYRRIISEYFLPI